MCKWWMLSMYKGSQWVINLSSLREFRCTQSGLNVTSTLKKAKIKWIQALRHKTGGYIQWPLIHNFLTGCNQLLLIWTKMKRNRQTHFRSSHQSREFMWGRSPGRERKKKKERKRKKQSKKEIPLLWFQLGAIIWVHQACGSKTFPPGWISRCDLLPRSRDVPHLWNLKEGFF